MIVSNWGAKKNRFSLDRGKIEILYSESAVARKIGWNKKSDPKMKIGKGKRTCRD
jgi:hypothetical protein